MPHNENSRVKIPALVHFTRLGYKYISLRKYEGVIDDDTNILVDVLCDAINRINATSLTTTDVQKIVNALKAMLENDDLGREFYSVLINGYNGLKLIDYEDFGETANSYHVVTEMTCKNGSDEFRPDITPLINGIAVAEGEFIPESLSYRLISYNHYSMKGNLAEKKTTLLDLANLLEPQRTNLERIDKTFSSDLFYTFNNFHIRHNNMDQLGTKYKKPVGDLSDEQLEYWYDEVYQMCLLAFMRLEHIDRKKKFDSLKSQIEGT